MGRGVDIQAEKKIGKRLRTFVLVLRGGMMVDGMKSQRNLRCSDDTMRQRELSVLFVKDCMCSIPLYQSALTVTFL